MNGKWLYYSAASLFGILCSLLHFGVFLGVMILYLALLYKFKNFTKSQLFTMIGVFFLFLLSGEKAEMMNHSNLASNNTTFYLTFNEDPTIDGDMLQIAAIEQAYKEKLLIRYKIKTEQEQNQLKNQIFYGRVCKVTGSLSKPQTAKNPNGFNYQQYLASKQIFWTLDLQNNPLGTCISSKTNLLTAVKQVRFLGIKDLNQHFPPEIASLSAALIFGDRSLLPDDLLTDYQKTGIVHLLAISGLHVSLLVAMFFYIGIRSGVTRDRMIHLLLLLLPIYAILTGSSPSVIRSVLMIILVLINVKWKQSMKLSTLDAISLAMMLYLFFAPYVVFDIGFQLSFSVTEIIIISSPIILKRYQHPITRMLSTSFIAQLAALPFLLYHYFELSFISILANLLYIPLFSFIYMPGFYILFFIQLIFKTTPGILLLFFVKIITFFNEFISQLANFPFTHLSPGRPDGPLLIIYASFIITLFLIWEAQTYPNRLRHLVLIMLLLFTFQTAWNMANPFGKVTAIDVGQGDSFLIHLPFNQGNYLIDTGGTVGFNDEGWRKRKKPFEVGRDVVVPYLKGQGITRIDKLILTHGDMDHIGGALSIIEELRVKEILTPSVTGQSAVEQVILNKARQRNIPVKKVSEGDEWTSSNAYFYVLSPEKDFTGESNRGSIAFFAKIGGLTWFFGGDLDQEGEENIIKKYPSLKVDVLKAGHHGSKTSSAESFINQLKPKIALISVGAKNRFGHPHKEVIERLNKNDAIIFRTDQQGAITYKFFNGKGTFYSYLP